MTNTKPLTPLQKFKAAYKKTFAYQVIFHPLRTLKKAQQNRIIRQETAGMSDDERYFYLRHKDIFGYKADFKNPQTFNEKIIHRILYDKSPIYTALADKLKARIYIAHKLQGLTQTNITQTRERERESNGADILGTPNRADSSNTLNSTNSTDILAKDSPLFAPIDSLNQALFATNACEFLPKLYGIWKSVSEIDFAKLPSAFVLKTNHDCGGVVIVPDKGAFLSDKATFDSAMAKLTKHLNTNYYTLYKEWHYNDIEPRVFAEELLVENNADPTTYKFHMFAGKSAFIQVTSDRFSEHYQRAIMDNEWRPTPFGIRYNNAELKHIPPRPTTLKAMIGVSRIISAPFGYVRSDIYSVDSSDGSRAIVGGLTFTPGGGTEQFVPNEWDKKFGDLWC